MSRFTVKLEGKELLDYLMTHFSMTEKEAIEYLRKINPKLLTGD